MGIPGLKDELGQGERISLGKLAINHLQLTKKPLRLAVDISIWLFQVQAAQGGSNPALRTLFFRLSRLVSLPIQPIFVFDGPRRPEYKRGKIINRNTGHGAQIELSKKLIELFSYVHHTAPGEAEAECAKLQKTGVVDAVMSDDVDTLMFGSTTTLLNFSKGSTKQSGAATHVNVYRTVDSIDGSEKNVSMDRGGMVLFALLSGGDYTPSGVTFCGRKLAGEIARAGFGDDLLKATRNMEKGSTGPVRSDETLEEWKERLQHELDTNQSGYFKTKHKAVRIPEEFPDVKVLRNCVEPVTSQLENFDKYRSADLWNPNIDVKRLRDFVSDYLGWRNLAGAKNFIRKFAPSFLNYQLFRRSLLWQDAEAPVRIGGSKSGDSQDGYPVLKLEYVPLHIVGLDLESEKSPSSASQLHSDDVIEYFSENDDRQGERSVAAKKRALSDYNPELPQTLWVYEALARRAIPRVVDNWYNEQEEKAAAKRKPPKKTASKPRTRARVLDPGMPVGAIRQYGTIVKSLRNDTKAPSTGSSKKGQAGKGNVSTSFSSWDTNSSDIEAIADFEHNEQGRSCPVTHRSSDQHCDSNLQDSLFRSINQIEQGLSRVHISNVSSSSSTQCDAQVDGQKPKHKLRSSSNSKQSDPLKHPDEDKDAPDCISLSSSPHSSSLSPILTSAMGESDAIQRKNSVQNIDIDLAGLRLNSVENNTNPTVPPTTTASAGHPDKEGEVRADSKSEGLFITIDADNGFWSYRQSKEDEAYSHPLEKDQKKATKPKRFGRVSTLDLT